MSVTELIALEPANPIEPALRMDRIPHIWCPGCGIGTTVNSFARALIGCGKPPEQHRHCLWNRLHRARRRLHEF